jgi:diguanylate cyclase (GGDEF)-like protein/PAS domain S-box-containing protein
MSYNFKSQSTDILTAFVRDSFGSEGSLEADKFGIVSALLDQLPALFSVVDSDGKILMASNLHTRLFGTPDDISEMTQWDHLFPAIVGDRIKSAPLIANPDDRGSLWELNLRHKDGSEHVYRMTKIRVPGRDGTVECLTGVDITDSKQTEDNLRDQQRHMDYVAYHDPLTGLANRSLFYERVHKCIASAKLTGDSFAVMLIDLDRFKKVNDSLGHDAGDAYLCYTARHLQQVLRTTDTTARLGGDEFVVVLESIRSEENVQKLANAVLASLAQTVTIQGHEIAGTASIGISIYPKDGEAVDQLLKHADQAMYQAKAAGKNRYAFFRRAMDDSAVNYLLLENDLRRAIDKDELTLHYQPQVDLRTGKIVGLEALARWYHRKRGFISPVHFIPLAEETGLIEPLGEWVLREACQRFQFWLSEGINFSKIAVNLSAKQFTERSFETVVEGVLKKTGLSPEFLELEITESSAMAHATETIETLTILSKMGLSLAIDDFGTGYSSLAYLKRFPIQKLKIDRSFIDDVDTGEGSSDAAIAQTIIDLARNMKVQVLAEGVERVTQSQWLLERGCDQVQGYFYSRPLSEEQLLELVSDGKALWEKDGVRLKI